MAAPISSLYVCDEVPGGGCLWWIRCPTCGTKFFIVIPLVRVIPCPECGITFVESGVTS